MVDMNSLCLLNRDSFSFCIYFWRGKLVKMPAANVSAYFSLSQRRRNVRAARVQNETAPEKL